MGDDGGFGTVNMRKFFGIIFIFFAFSCATTENGKRTKYIQVKVSDLDDLSWGIKTEAIPDFYGDVVFKSELNVYIAGTYPEEQVVYIIDDWEGYNTLFEFRQNPKNRVCHTTYHENIERRYDKNKKYNIKVTVTAHEYHDLRYDNNGITRTRSTTYGVYSIVIDSIKGLISFEELAEMDAQKERELAEEKQIRELTALEEKNAREQAELEARKARELEAERIANERAEARRIAEEQEKKYYVFNDQRAAKAQMLTYDELDFLYGSKKLIPGTLYRVQCFFYFKSGDRVFIRKNRTTSAGNTIALKVDRIVDFYEGQPIDILFDYRLDKEHRIIYELFAIEIIRRYL